MNARVTFVSLSLVGALALTTARCSAPSPAGAEGDDAAVPDAAAVADASSVDGGGGAPPDAAVSRDAGDASVAFDMTQTLSDGAQLKTLSFSALAMLTGTLESQSFFPPGKVADYTGFQYLRDNDPDGMGHNTSFLTRVANNVLLVLDDAQIAKLVQVAVGQIASIERYGYDRFPLMMAFRREVDGVRPGGSVGLNAAAVAKASRELYLVDGAIAFDRAKLYAEILVSLSPSQRAYLDGMRGRGWRSWPDVTNAQVRAKTQGLAPSAGVAVMTYAGDLFSWYAGSVEADVYFCPERHGTYFGSFYMKDAPAIGHEGYAIDTQVTATAGGALSMPAKGYVNAEQAAFMTGLLDTQRANLYGGSPSNIVALRTRIASRLRDLLAPNADATAIRAEVLELSATYGELDGANNHAYATAMARLGQSLSADQRARLMGLRRSIMAGTYADGTAFDFTVCTTPYLYSAPITESSVVAGFSSRADALFFAP